MAGTSLFDPSLLPSQALSSLPEGYSLRPLRISDYNKGFPSILRVLTSVGDISEERFRERYNFMKQREGEYYIIVVLDGSSSPDATNTSTNDSVRPSPDNPLASGDDSGEGKIVGTGALLVERKFIHNLGLVGHIEDIAVAKDQQGKKLGLRIIQALDGMAENVGCYKCILDASEANEGFYLKCGFRRAGLEMARYYDR